MAATIHGCVEPRNMLVLAMPERLALAGGRSLDVLVVDARGMDRVVIGGVPDAGCLPLPPRRQQAPSNKPRAHP